MLDLGFSFFRTDEGEAGGAGTGVEFNVNRLSLTDGAVLKPDDEREPTVVDRGPGLEQRPRPRRMAGHERFLAFAEHEDPALLRNAGLTASELSVPRANGGNGSRLLDSAHLDSVASQRAACAAASARFGAIPRLVCCGGFKSLGLMKHPKVSVFELTGNGMPAYAGTQSGKRGLRR